MRRSSPFLGFTAALGVVFLAGLWSAWLCAGGSSRYAAGVWAAREPGEWFSRSGAVRVLSRSERWELHSADVFTRTVRLRIELLPCTEVPHPGGGMECRWSPTWQRLEVEVHRLGPGGGRHRLRVRERRKRLDRWRCVSRFEVDERLSPGQRLEYRLVLSCISRGEAAERFVPYHRFDPSLVPRDSLLVRVPMDAFDSLRYASRGASRLKALLGRPRIAFGDGWGELRWSLREGDAVAIGASDGALEVRCGLMEDWRQVSSRLAPGLRRRLRSSARLAEFVRTLGLDGRSCRERAWKIAAALGEGFSYVSGPPSLDAMLDGPGADGIFSLRRGDCVDLAVMVCAALRVAGVQAEPAFLCRRGYRAFFREVPSLFCGDHCIVMLRDEKGRALWLDPAACSWAPPGVLPLDEDGVSAFLPLSCALETTSSLEESRMSFVVDLRLGSTGRRASFSLRLEAEGASRLLTGRSELHPVTRLILASARSCERDVRCTLSRSVLSVSGTLDSAPGYWFVPFRGGRIFVLPMPSGYGAPEFSEGVPFGALEYPSGIRQEYELRVSAPFSRRSLVPGGRFSGSMDGVRFEGGWSESRPGGRLLYRELYERRKCTFSTLEEKAAYRRVLEERMRCRRTPTLVAAALRAGGSSGGSGASVGGAFPRDGSSMIVGDCRADERGGVRVRLAALASGGARKGGGEVEWLVKAIRALAPGARLERRIGVAELFLEDFLRPVGRGGTWFLPPVLLRGWRAGACSAVRITVHPPRGWKVALPLVRVPPGTRMELLPDGSAVEEIVAGPPEMARGTGSPVWLPPLLLERGKVK